MRLGWSKVVKRVLTDDDAAVILSLLVAGGEWGAEFGERHLEGLELADLAGPLRERIERWEPWRDILEAVES